MIPGSMQLRRGWDIFDMFFLSFIVFWDVLYLAFATYYMGGVPAFPPTGLEGQIYWTFFAIINMLVLMFWVMVTWMVRWRRTA